jgi:alkylated DNA repair dioxygenase AlkB
MSRIELPLGAWIELREGWLPDVRARELEQAMLRDLIWEQRHILLFGKRILQPRLIAWAGELPYRYSGQTLEPRPWPKALVALVAPIHSRLAALSGVDFNHVLINRYRDGKDSMGYHADAEPELGPDPVVACLSLGHTRRFVLRQHVRGPAQIPLSLSLTHGSLLIMGGTCQRHYRHAVPRDPSPVPAERVSLTFRHLLRSPS